MNGNLDLEREPVCRSQAISEHKAGNKATLLDLIAIFNGNIASLYEGLLLNVSLCVNSGSASKQRNECLT